MIRKGKCHLSVPGSEPNVTICVLDSQSLGTKHFTRFNLAKQKTPGGRTFCNSVIYCIIQNIHCSSMREFYLPVLLTTGLATRPALDNEMWTEAETCHFSEPFRSSTWIAVFPCSFYYEPSSAPNRNFSSSLGARLKATDGKPPASPWWACTWEWENQCFML